MTDALLPPYNSSSLISTTSDSAIVSPSNMPGGFVLWELRSTNCPLLHNADSHNADWHYAGLHKQWGDLLYT
jgi:hypothetical protein